MKFCNAKECDRKSYAKGYCDKHYRRVKKTGTAEKTSFTQKECHSTECKRGSKSKGLCDMHYRRFKKTGTFKKIDRRQACKMEGCENKHLAKSLCYTHYWMNAKKINIDHEANLLIKNHNGLCDICGTEKPGYAGRRLCIDHDHSTGIVRGMLCQKCNVGLGNFNDNLELLEKAIKYLKK